MAYVIEALFKLVASAMIRRGENAAIITNPDLLMLRGD